MLLRRHQLNAQVRNLANALFDHFELESVFPNETALEMYKKDYLSESSGDIFKNIEQLEEILSLIKYKQKLSSEAPLSKAFKRFKENIRKSELEKAKREAFMKDLTGQVQALAPKLR